jgi:hypothetical protein
MSKIFKDCQYKICFVLLCSLHINCFCQTDTTFLDSFYHIVTAKNEADIFRLSSMENRYTPFVVNDYLKTGELLFQGKVLYLNSGYCIGNCFYYREDSSIQAEVVYSNLFDKYQGNKEVFRYRNGKVMTEIFWQKDGRLKFNTFFDSTGQSQLEEGNGFLIVPFEKKNIVNIGKVKGHYKDSIWVGIDKKTGKKLFSEKYVKGKLIYGERIAGDAGYKYKAEIEILNVDILNTLKRKVRKDHPELVGQCLELFIENGIVTRCSRLVKEKDSSLPAKIQLEIGKRLLVIERGVPLQTATIPLCIE